jgi:hypothetical protein
MPHRKRAFAMTPCNHRPSWKPLAVLTDKNIAGNGGFCWVHLVTVHIPSLPRRGENFPNKKIRALKP